MLTWMELEKSDRRLRCELKNPLVILSPSKDDKLMLRQAQHDKESTCHPEPVEGRQAHASTSPCFDKLSMTKNPLVILSLSKDRAAALRSA
jgi:hypothetical protein